MNFISEQLNIKLLKDVQSPFPCIYFQFKGKFTEQASISGTMTWSAEMDQHPEESFEMVWDCREMNGFEVSARTEWYNCMMKYKSRIAKVYVVGGGLMIRSAAKVMLNYFGIENETHQLLKNLPTGYR
jgi:hypothetical protein